VTFARPVLDAFSALLSAIHDGLVPVFGIHAWGWAIVVLTLIVRVALLPLAIKQTRSMRAMTALQPQVKALQEKYKADRDLMRRDPEKYKARKQKLNEELMALYQREGANPAASCLPLLAQAPIFLALFWTLRDKVELQGAEFHFFTTQGSGGLEMLVREASWPGWLLILIMSGTMFWSQKQMMARTAASQVADNPMAQQQKILLYVMPVFLAFISINFPLGILLYWCTTNAWQVAQQAIIMREVKHEVEAGTLTSKPGGHPDDDGPVRRSPGASSGKRAVETSSSDGDADLDEDGDERTGGGSAGGGPSSPPKPRLPRRGGGR
jgi:YidC/Oxa1 family membrane protein insertase